MEEIVIPKGKSLRFRCGVEGCQVSNKHFSVVSVYEHIASHFSRIHGNAHYNYRCCSCGRLFYLLGMTECCPCKKVKEGLESVRKDLTMKAVRHDIQFMAYYKLHIIPVLVKDSLIQQTSKSNVSKKPVTPKQQQTPRPQPEILEISTEDNQNSHGMGTPPMRSPSMYADGTPRTPRQDDEVEEAAPAYVRAMRSRCQSRAGTPTNMDTTDNENSAHNVPEPSNGPTRTSNDPTSEPTEKVSKPTSFAWPPPTDDPDLFRKFRCPPTQPSTSNGHQQDLGHSTQPPVPSTAPATPQDTRQSDNNAGTDLTNRNNSTANDEGTILPPPPTPPSSLSLNSHDTRNLQSDATSSSANGEKVERRSRARSTVRVPTRRSRQDALLEENPSPPPVSRRRTSRSPTPFRRSPSPEPRPRTPGENRRSPAMGSAYEPREDRFAPAASTNRMSRRDTVGDRVPIAPGVQRMPNFQGTSGSTIQAHASVSNTSVARGSHTSRSVKTHNTRSRQDAVHEEDSSPPPSNHRVTRSPGPMALPGSCTPKDTSHVAASGFTPGHASVSGGRTPAHHSATPYGSRTPSYGSYAGNFPKYCNGSPSHGSEDRSQTPSQWNQNARYDLRPRTPSQGNRTPYYEGGSRTPVQGNRTPYYEGGSRTPPHGSRTPYYNSGNRTPGQENPTPYYNSGIRTPAQGGQTPYYNSCGRTLAHENEAPHCDPAFRTARHGGQTPYYNTRSHSSGQTPCHDSEVNRSGACTPRYGSRTPEPYASSPPPPSRGQQDGSDDRSRNRYRNTAPSSHSHGDNGRSGYAGHTPMRSPSQYEDGTCRTPRQESDEEEDLPAYRRGQDDPVRQPKSRAGYQSGGQENINPPSSQGLPPNNSGFVSTTQYPTNFSGIPPNQATPQWSYAFPPPPFPDQLGMYPMNWATPIPVHPLPNFGAPLIPPPPPNLIVPPPPPPPVLPSEISPPANMSGQASGPTASNSQARSANSRKSSCSTTPKCSSAPKPPERVGGSKFLDSVPPVPKANANPTSKRSHQRK